MTCYVHNTHRLERTFFVRMLMKRLYNLQYRNQQSTKDASQYLTQTTLPVSQQTMVLRSSQSKLKSHKLLAPTVFHHHNTNFVLRVTTTTFKYKMTHTIQQKKTWLLIQKNTKPLCNPIMTHSTYRNPTKQQTNSYNFTFSIL